MGRRLLLALAAAVLLLAGCGDERGSTSPPTPSPDAPTTTVPGPGWSEIAIVTGTAAGGTVSTTPVPVDTQEALDAFVAQFERSDLADQVVGAVSGASIPDGWVPAAAVIAVGCDIPPGVVVDDREGFTIHAEQVNQTMQECFAPMTSVAVIAVDPALL